MIENSSITATTSLQTRSLKSSRSRTQVNNWLKSIENWLQKLERLEREGRLILQLLQISTHGQKISEHTLTMRKQFTDVLQNDIGGFKKELLLTREQPNQMLKLPLLYKDRIGKLRKAMIELTEKYEGKKIDILKELIHVHPITIF